MDILISILESILCDVLHLLISACCIILKSHNEANMVMVNDILMY